MMDENSYADSLRVLVEAQQSIKDAMAALREPDDDAARVYLREARERVTDAMALMASWDSD